MKALLKILTIVFTMTTVSGCVAVKPYEMMYLSDESMQLKIDKLGTFDMNFESYREGASGANGGKTGGGCGCN